MEILRQLPAWLKNKYLLSAGCLLAWMFFFDDRDLVTTYIKQPTELRQLQASKAYYEKQIISTRFELDKLKTNAATIEQYAREKYRMKRDNEDLFIIENSKK
jgi:cell division protein DivIC